MPEDDNTVRLPRSAKGARSRFFADPAIDQMMTFVLEFMAEFSSLAERVDAIERLLDEKGTLTRADIEGFTPDPGAEAERKAWAEAFVARVLRLHDPGA